MKPLAGRTVAWAMMVLALAGPTLARRAEAPPRAATDWRATVRDFAARHFKNPAWGYSHSMRDYALARELAALDRVPLDDDVLFAAAYLHDIAAYAPWADEKLDHSDVGARVIDPVLLDTGFPMSKIDAVRGAIRTHMYYRVPVGPEALYLHDADALDWLGAIGAARVLALIDPNGGDPNAVKAEEMLAENLAKVPQRVISPAGRARMPALKAELERFLAELRRETQDFKTL